MCDPKLHVCLGHLRGNYSRLGPFFNLNITLIHPIIIIILLRAVEIMLLIKTSVLLIEMLRRMVISLRCGGRLTITSTDLLTTLLQSLNLLLQVFWRPANTMVQYIKRAYASENRLIYIIISVRVLIIRHQRMCN